MKSLRLGRQRCELIDRHVQRVTIGAALHGRHRREWAFISLDTYSPRQAQHTGTEEQRLRTGLAPPRRDTDDSRRQFIGGLVPYVPYSSSTSVPLAPMNPSAAATRIVEPPRVFARLPTVMQATGLGRSTIYRLVASGSFPAPVHLGPRAVGWRWSDLERWSESRRCEVR